jgi:hypothetical protein
MTCDRSVVFSGYSGFLDEENHIIKKQSKKGRCAHKTSLAKPLLLKLLFQASEVSCHVFVGIIIVGVLPTTFAISSCHHLQQYVFNFVNDLRQVGGFLHQYGSWIY